MIWTYITIALIIVGIVLLIVEDVYNKWLINKVLITLGVTNLVVGVMIGLIIGTVAILNHTTVDKRIYEARVEYESITKQLQTIDSEYEDVSKTEVIQKVYDWNVNVYKSKYWTKSPWTNWLCSKKYSDSLKYIEIEEE